MSKAEEFFFKSLKIKIKILGYNHVAVADYLYNLGLFYHKRGNEQIAYELY